MATSLTACTRRGLQRFFSAILVVIFFLQFQIPAARAAVGRKAMVTTADSRATRAALQILQKGGNAVDAAIAAQWVLNVVEPQSSGIGGGGFFLYYEASSGRIYTFDGREKAPAEAYPEMFLDEKGKACEFKDCATGGRPVGVPGTLKLLNEVYERFSAKKLTFGELFEPAIQIAEEGFPVSRRLSRFIVKERDRLMKFEDSRKTFLDKEGMALKPGYILQQPDLAATFRAIQKKGYLVFYEGEIAEDIVEAVRYSKIHPGVMKMSDLKYYEIKERDPVRGTYRGYDIFSMGPPSSGGTTLIEALNIMELHPFAEYGRKPDGVHLFAEAQKLAFQDRNEYLGDPDFSKPPVEKLISKQHARDRAELIDFERAIPDTPLPMKVQPESNYTSHMSIVDERGNIVSFTTTIEDIFGCAMMVPGRGFFLNNELTDFDMLPKRENGKLKANAPEGEKRPRSSMTPTLIFSQGKPALVVGSPGGSKIIGIVLNIVANVLDLEMPLDQAVAAPRIVNRAGPVEMEPALFENDAQRASLAKRGHKIQKVEEFGNAQAIYFDRASGFIIGSSDPRGEGEAAGY